MGVPDTISIYTRGSCCQSRRGRWEGGDEIPYCPAEYGCQDRIFIRDSSSKEKGMGNEKGNEEEHETETRQNII